MPNAQKIITTTTTSLPAMFRHPEPSQADHRPSLRSRGSHRGSFVGGAIPTEIVYESHLEYDWIIVLLATPDVLHLREQVRVRYRDGGWRDPSHIFDLLVTMRDGRRILVAIKPRWRAERIGLVALMRLIAPQVPRQLADGIVVLTERRLTETMRRDAELIRSVRRDEAGPDDEAILATMAGTVGSIAIRDLVRATGRGGQGFRATVRRIAAGDLVLASPPPIAHASLVALPGRAVNHHVGFPGLGAALPSPTRGGRTNETQDGASA